MDRTKRLNAAVVGDAIGRIGHASPADTVPVSASSDDERSPDEGMHLVGELVSRPEMLGPGHLLLLAGENTPTLLRSARGSDRVPLPLPAADFLSLPERPRKPRQRGLTHVVDGGLPIVTLESLLDLAAAHIDFVKFGWGTAYVSRHIRAKIVACRAAGVTTCTGGTLLEVAAAQGKVEQFRRWACHLGIDAIEVSEGTVELSRKAKRDLIRTMAQDFVVLAEVGSKNPTVPVVPSEWSEQMERDLDAGAAFVVAEGRESGTVGLYGGDGEVRTDLVEALLARVPFDSIIFEAPKRTQQTWFLQKLGVDANLGNIAHTDVIGVETLRRGLRADTAHLSIPLP